MTHTIPREFIELLLAKINLVELIHHHVPLRKKSGNNHFARCPFHQEKSASFSVSEQKQFYYCFGCGAHGNAIDFVMQYEHVSFPEAIATLAKEVGMIVPQDERSAKRERDTSTLYTLLSQVAQYYYQQLSHSPAAIQYLKNRGISGITAKRFLLGYAPPGWHHVVEQFGKTETDKKLLIEAGLITKKEGAGYYDRFRDRLMFPICDYRGRVIGFGGRVMDEAEPKYLNSPETTLFQKGHELYGLDQVKKAMRGSLDRVLVVEGYMDVIQLFEHDIHYVVATLGTATTAHHLRCLFRYTTEIIFCFDGDAAGRLAAERALSVIFPLMQDHLQLRFLFLPEGEDPDSLVKQEGKATFEARLAGALTLSQFFFQTLGEGALTTPDDRARFAAKALQQMKPLPQGLFRDLVIEELKKRTRIPEAQLKREGGTPASPASPIPTTAQPPAIPALPRLVQRMLMLLVQHPALAALLHGSFPASHLEGVDIILQLLEIINKNPSITTGGLLEYGRGKPIEALLAHFATCSHLIPEEGLNHEFLGLIRQFTDNMHEEAIDQLLAKATSTGLSDAEKKTLSEHIAQRKALTAMIS
jgi:DNA primase